MDPLRIYVNDKEDVKISIINNVDIRILDVKLGHSVSVNAILKNDEQFIKSENITISGEEYDNWGSDDLYLEDLILTKLGVTRKEIV